MDNQNTLIPALRFYEPFDKQAQFEAKAKGFYGIATVVFPDSREYPVTFYDLTRLSQDLQYELLSGVKCIAEPGLVVIGEVTIKNMEDAVRNLAETGYFDTLVPLNSRTSSP